MKKLRQYTLLGLCLLGLSACSSGLKTVSIDHAGSIELGLPDFNDGLFETKPVISEADISSLTPEQEAHFLNFFNQAKFSKSLPNERVASYMGIILDQFTFSDETLTAKQAMESKSGNCLSLTILTGAFAKLADVKVGYQLLDKNPVFTIEDDLLVTSDHLRAVLISESATDQPFPTKSFIRIDYFNTDGYSYVDNINPGFQLSLFYSNVAVEHLRSGDISSAFAYAKHALSIYPLNPSALNTIGISHRYREDLVKAEEIYLYGAKNYDKSPTFLRNYLSLLINQRGDIDWDTLERNALSLDQSNPWTWVQAGNVAYSQAEFARASDFYNKALNLEPSLHQLYFLASRANHAAGNMSEAYSLMSNAMSIAKDESSGKRYKAKLRDF